MEIDIQITLKEDFNMLCSIYEIKPEVIIQSFIDQVSFPCYYSQVDKEKDKWAILFFLQYLDSDDYEDEINEKLQDYYLDRFSKVVAKNLDKHPKDRHRAEEAGRHVIKQWEKAVLAERARYITDKY